MATKRFGILLWIACLVGAAALLPHYFYLAGSIPKTTLVFADIAGSSIAWGIICWLSFLLLQRVDLTPFSSTNFLKQVIYPGTLSGILVGVVITILTSVFFSHSVFLSKTSPLWATMLASIYKGLNEEVLMRLFFLTLVYFLLTKLFKEHQRYRPYLQWTAILIAALGFGGGHLRVAFTILPALSGFEIFRILFLNGIARIVFGWLYCTRGFWAAVTSHFVTALIVRSFL